MNATNLLEKTYGAPSLELPWQDDIVALRRDFHANPELGFEEFRTAKIVAERLRALGLEVKTGVGKTGAVGVLRGGKSTLEKPGPTVLVRADMDALPVDEKNDWPWKSSTRNKMHACGHDCHMSIALTVARLLSEKKEEFCGTIKFMFQPAEEGLGGAERMIRDGLLENPKPDFALALHVWSEIEVGEIGLSSGPVMACVDGFKAKIIGKGGHGAIPQQTIDPLVAAAHLVLALQTVVSRNVDPLCPAVVTVGKLEAGSAFNVISNEATLEATLRAFDEPTRALLERRCREIVETLPVAFGARSEFEFLPGFPATVNAENVTEKIRPALENVVGAENVRPFTPTMGAEDFSLVLQQIPGCYFFVGGRSESSNSVYPHHHERFNIDERALEIGARAMLAAVEECLKA